jgi:CMP-N-acetylneuraminic acid synthetase
MIYHADMYLCPGALDAIEREIEEKVIVSLTRIEPPLHPDGPEKILRSGGVEPEEFLEEDLLKQLPSMKDASKVTEGIFAPWAFYRKDFQEIGGHDALYAPQSKEDSDIFNRFQLNGVKFKQVWDGFVYHMTSRGSRRNTLDKAKNIYEDSPEWLAWQHMLDYLFEEIGAFPEAIVVLPTTAPLRLSIDINNCLDEFEKGNAETIITVTDAHRNPYFNMVKKNKDGTVKIVNSLNFKISRRQDAPIVYDMATVCYVVKPEFIITNNAVFEGRVKAIHVPPERAIDIDTLLDFQITEGLLKLRGNKQ